MESLPANKVEKIHRELGPSYIRGKQDDEQVRRLHGECPLHRP